MSVGGIDLFHSAYEPLLFRCLEGRGRRRRQTSSGSLERHGERVAAVIVEPLVQGAAGIRVQPPGYLRDVRRLCDRFGTLLICDEVATGFGRTGTMFACEQERVSPDFLCLGKGLTGGYLPLAATLATERVYEGFLGAPEEGRTFFHGHTFTGNPLACAAGLANLDAFEREHTLASAAAEDPPASRAARQGIAELDEVAEVRGRGFMVGIDLGEHDPGTSTGPPGRRSRHASAARSSGRSATSSC